MHAIYMHECPSHKDRYAKLSSYLKYLELIEGFDKNGIYSKILYMYLDALERIIFSRARLNSMICAAGSATGSSIDIDLPPRMEQEPSGIDFDDASIPPCTGITSDPSSSLCPSKSGPGCPRAPRPQHRRPRGSR